jgi:hypothetical protein
MANQIKTKFIGNDQVTNEKILLENNAALRAKDAAGTGEVELIKVNATDEVVITNLVAPSSDEDAATKKYVDDAVAGGGAALANHLSDSEDAHDASAISFSNTASGMAADDVQSAIDELDADKVAKSGDSMTGDLNMIVGPSTAAKIGFDLTTLIAEENNTFGPGSYTALASNSLEFIRTPEDDGDSNLSMTLTRNEGLTGIESVSDYQLNGETIFGYQTNLSARIGDGFKHQYQDNSTGQNKTTILDYNGLIVNDSGNPLTIQSGSISSLGDLSITSDSGNGTINIESNVDMNQKAITNANQFLAIDPGSNSFGDLSAGTLLLSDGTKLVTVNPAGLLSSNTFVQVGSNVLGSTLALSAENVDCYGDLNIQSGKKITGVPVPAQNGQPLVYDQLGAINGVAPLNSSQKIESQYLPSYVDDVLEFADVAAFPATGESGKIYVALDTSKVYRWSGSTYIEVSPSEVNSVNGQTGIVTLDSDDITEGATNLYYTSVRQAAIEAYADQAEADAKSYADGLNTAMDSRVDALEAKAFYKHKVVFSGQSFVDLPHEAASNSINAFVDRLAIHEGASEDFTVSVVGGVTRITFVNQLVSPGNQQLQNGDNLYFNYYK